MKKTIFILGVCFLLAATTISVRSQTTATTDQSIQGGVSDLQTMLETIESVPPLPASQLPESGTFWSAQHAPGTPLAWPPLPGNIWGLDAWSLGDGQYLLNDTNLDYDALAAVAQAAQTTSASPMMQMNMMASSYAYGNPVYLTNIAASFAPDGSIAASFDIIGGTNFVPYDILMTTNLAMPVHSWTWLGIGYPSNNYTFSEQPADLGFYILAKPSQTMTVPWGDDSYGECSNMPVDLTNVVQVAAGEGQSLALRADGTVVAWGRNDQGQATVPTNLTGVAMIAAGAGYNVALLTNGMVTSWGLNLFGQTNVPPDLTNATVISAGTEHALALRSDGTVVAWGYNSAWGETNVPAGLSNVTAISAGFGHNLAVSNGWVVAWGDNDHGQCNVPTGLSNVVDVAAGLYHSLALLNNGTVVAWGDNAYGETNVPAGLTNVVAIAAGGDYYPGQNSAYSLALKSDGMVVAWGDGEVLNPISGLSNVISISGGLNHALAIRTGPPTPVITLEPTDEYQVQGGNATFTARGTGLYGVTYQWQFNGMDLTGATNATLTVTNVQSGQLGSYDVIVTDNGGLGSITSSNANLYLVTAPVINSETLPTNELVFFQNSLTLQVTASAPGQSNGFPISYQWQFDGTNISRQTSSNYTFTAINSGTYSLIVSNAAGAVTVTWQVTVIYPGAVVAWGLNPNNELNAPFQLTNVISVAAGEAHGVVALDSGAVTNWGSYWTGTNFVPVTPPPPLTNALAVAAGSRHDLALKADGTVVAWGFNDFGQTNVPGNVTNAIAIAAGGQESLALLQNGTVVQWGQTNAPLPGGLTNVTAIAAGTNFNLALLQNSTVVAWGANNYGQTNVPAGLSNVVAVAAGGAHALALEQNGTVVAWGDNTYGEANVPTNLTNAMKIAAGDNHSIALENNGTVIAWGDDTYGQTNVINGLSGVKLIAGGGDFTLAVQFSTTVMYPINVSQDLLLIYNTNSTDSATVLNYYLAHRPMVSGANVLGIGCTTNETFLPSEYTNVFAVQVQAWLAANPTKRPQYVVLFYDVPSRVNTINSPPGAYPNLNQPTWPSVQYQLATGCAAEWNPFVTSINMGTTNDCIAYINKLADMDTNDSLLISASASGYGNTNWYFDDTAESGLEGVNPGLSASNTVVQAGAAPASVTYTNVPSNLTLAGHITNGVNVAGYMSFGVHGYYGETNATYATNGSIIFNGNSGWWIIETVESYNGQRYRTSQGTFVTWFSSNAFGGTNYSNTPIGAVSHVDEPSFGGQNNPSYFGLWQSGKNFAICSWNSRQTPYFQAVGDPLISK